MSEATRRRILCLQPAPRPDASPGALQTSDAWIEALRRHADILVVESDCDLAQLCAAARPDLIVADAVSGARTRPVAIENPRTCPDIPRILFLNSHPLEPLRVMTMRLVEVLGIETVFCSGDSHLRYMPELRRLPHAVVAPFVDDTVFRDYGLEKTIPVSVFGDDLQSGFQPWRIRLLQQVQHVFPTLIYTLPQAAGTAGAPFALQREDYAKLLNQSWFSAADTTRVDCGTERHMEIAASGAVLIGPPSNTLADLGFQDAESCLLGDGAELFHKMDRVSRDPEAYARIRNAGAALVHSRYASRNWRPLLDWLECRLRLKPGQNVQQVGRFGPFRGVTPSAAQPSLLARERTPGDLPALLRAARDVILSGESLTPAATQLEEAASWVPDAAETHFLRGMIALLNGAALDAAIAIGRRAQDLVPLGEVVTTLDPVETAWLLFIARLLGNAELEDAMREQAAFMQHLSLRRIVWLLEGKGVTVADDALLARQPGDLVSVHWLGDEDFALWRKLVGRALAANGTAASAAMMSSLLAATG